MLSIYYETWPQGDCIDRSRALLPAAGEAAQTAVLAAGFSRFTLGLWPAIVTAALFGLWSLREL